MGNINAIVNASTDANNQMAATSVAAAQDSVAAALKGVQLTAQMQAISNQGILAQMQMQLNSTQNNVAMDTAAMAQRAAMTMLSKQTDQFAYNEMMREKVTNLFLDMEKQRTDNAWQRAKSAVQSMKY